MILLNAIATILTVVSLIDTEPVRNEVRKNFVDAAQNLSLRESLVENLRKEQQLEMAFKKAYLGASVTMMAEVVVAPWSKYNHFYNGTNLLDEAIAMEPSVGEFRHLRFMIQLMCPSFLGYYEEMEEDYRIVKQAIRTSPDKELWMTHFLAFEKEHMDIIRERLEE